MFACRVFGLGLLMSISLAILHALQPTLRVTVDLDGY
jgi:hypothetical protein